jgi:hypothetical protein
MDLDRSQLAQLGCGALGAAVGGVAAWTLPEGGYDHWAVNVLVAYPIVVGVIAVAFEHERGALRGLGAALGRIAWFIGAGALWVVLLTILFAPFALVLIHPVAERFQEHFPNASQKLVSGLFVAFGVAILGALAKTEAGAMVLGFAFEGLGKGAFLMPPMLWLLIVWWPVSLVTLAIVWLSGWDGRHGSFGAVYWLVAGVVAGAVHGFYAARWAASEADA